MHLLIVIPARLGSTRIPQKPLRLLAGEPLIVAVVRRVLELDLDAQTVVASDDERVLKAVARLGIDGVLTSSHHTCGTERVAEVVSRPEFSAVDTVLNVQGDEPFIRSEAVLGALEWVGRGEPIGTVAVDLDPQAVADGGKVRVVVGRDGRALAFSRTMPDRAAWPGAAHVLQHVGVYAYSRPALEQWANLPAVPEELVQGLEQLRPLKYGIPVGVTRVAGPGWPSIDTEDDLAMAEAR